MKRLFLLLFMYVFSLNAYSQTAYYDALYLGKLSVTELESLQGYADFYFKSGTGQTFTLDQFKGMVQGNSVKVKDRSTNNDVQTTNLSIQYKGIEVLKFGTGTDQKDFSSIKYESSSGTLAYSLFPPSLNLTSGEREQVKAYLDFYANPFNPSLNALRIDQLRSAIEKYNVWINSLQAPKRINGFNMFAGVGSLLKVLPLPIDEKLSFDPENESRILDGLTKYYSEQFKKAQLLTYMNIFKNTIGKIGELQVILPETYKKLENVNPSKFPDLGGELKEIFDQDLQNLLDNLIDHIDNHARVTSQGAYTHPKPDKNKTSYHIKDTESAKKLDEALKYLNGAKTSKLRKNDLFIMVRIAKDITSKLSNNYQLADLLAYLDASYFESNYITTRNGVDEHIAYIVHGINLFQSNLRKVVKAGETASGNSWLSFAELKEINTPQEMMLFAGLLYQQDKAYFKNLFFPRIIAPGPTELRNIEKRIEKILSLVIEIQDFKNAITQEDEEGSYLRYMEMILKMIETLNSNNDDISKGMELLRSTLNVYDNIRNKEYGNILYHSINVISTLLDDDQVQEFLKVVHRIEKYTSFMADVVKAENSDEVKDLIAKHAAPPTTFMLKRERSMVWSIGGHPGYFIGNENLINDNKGAKLSTGLTLPIGLEVAVKTKRGADNSSSLSLFIQALDLGAILNYRNDQDAELPDKVEFSQVLSLGASLNYGFKNSPLTIGFGYQRTPELRKITVEANEIFPKGDRWFLRFAWDIPLISLWKSKKR